MPMDTVFALLPVTVTNMVPLASLLTVKLLICAPLPFKVWLLLAQLLVFSLKPPYHRTVLLTVESEGFMTENMAPHRKDVLTYLKQVPVLETVKEPGPVITVGLSHGPAAAVGVKWEKEASPNTAITANSRASRSQTLLGREVKLGESIISLLIGFA